MISKLWFKLATVAAIALLMPRSTQRNKPLKVSVEISTTENETDTENESSTENETAAEQTANDAEYEFSNIKKWSLTLHIANKTTLSLSI